MKISGTGPIRRTSESGRPKKKGRERALILPLSLTKPRPIRPPRSVAPARWRRSDALLSVQEVTDSTKGRTRGAVRAQFMIDGLDEIRQGLLIGAIPKSKLAALVEVVREERDQADDAKLSALLDETELRAAVELAKLDQLA